MISFWRFRGCALIDLFRADNRQQPSTFRHAQAAKHLFTIASLYLLSSGKGESPGKSVHAMKKISGEEKTG